jgi:hypothetical protein
MWDLQYLCLPGLAAVYCIGLEVPYLSLPTVSYGIGVEDLEVYLHSPIILNMDYLVPNKKAYVLTVDVDKFKYLRG